MVSFSFCDAVEKGDAISSSASRLWPRSGCKTQDKISKEEWTKEREEVTGMFLTCAYGLASISFMMDIEIIFISLSFFFHPWKGKANHGL